MLAGRRDDYDDHQGQHHVQGPQDLLALEMPPELRAAEGVFLGFQYPVAIPGVSNIYFLKAVA